MCKTRIYLVVKFFRSSIWYDIWCNFPPRDTQRVWDGIDYHQSCWNFERGIALRTVDDISQSPSEFRLSFLGLLSSLLTSLQLLAGEVTFRTRCRYCGVAPANTSKRDEVKGSQLSRHVFDQIWYESSSAIVGVAPLVDHSKIEVSRANIGAYVR